MWSWLVAHVFSMSSRDPTVAEMLNTNQASLLIGIKNCQIVSNVVEDESPCAISQVDIPPPRYIDKICSTVPEIDNLVMVAVS